MGAYEVGVRIRGEEAGGVLGKISGGVERGGGGGRSSQTLRTAFHTHHEFMSTKQFR